MEDDMSQSVQRAIELIRLSAERPVSLSDAARILDVHKSTALRILQTLQAERFVRKTGAGTYVFGSGLIELSELTLGSMDLRQHAGGVLRALQHRTGHTVHLAQLTGDEVIYIDKVHSPASKSVQLPSRIGHAVSIYATAVGKVVLAHLPPLERDRLLAHITFQRFTSTTVSDRDALEVELASVRSHGWGVDNGELESYIRCIAVPVRDSRGRVVAAISLTALEMVAPLASLKEHLPSLVAAAHAVSNNLGHVEGLGNTI
jgi:DNA-binding IclR family transcriptional regulator